MVFETSHEIHTGVFSTKISFSEFGSESMNEAQEKELFEDLGYPQFNLGELEFVGKFSVDADKRVVEDEDAGEEVKIIVNSKMMTVGPNFVAAYSVDSANIPESEVGTVLNSKKLVAEAKCVLFDTVVKAKVQELVEAAKSEKTRFETAEVASLIV